MTRVIILSAEKQIRSITITDHADFAPEGQDVVCAGISSISTGALNALDELFPGQCKLSMKGKTIRIETESSEAALQNCLQMLIIQLKTVQEVFPGNIKITKKEV